MPEQISLTVRLRGSWLASRQERGRNVHQGGADLRAGDDVDSATGFARWAGRLAEQADTSRPTGEGRAHASYWWNHRALSVGGGIPADPVDADG